MESNWESRQRRPDAHLAAVTNFLPDEVATPALTMDPVQAFATIARQAPELKPKREGGLHGEEGVQPVTADDFVRILLTSGLLDEPQLEAWIQSHTQTMLADSGVMASALVTDKILTPYQAQVLSSGRARGLILGKYELLCPLGEGGMGMVFRARHRRMKREVALKILPRDVVKSEATVQRFHREVQAAAKLHHPNIAAAYDADEEDGLHFLVMELVEGPDLANYVAEAGELPAPVAVQLTIQAARGLSHAHLQGVVHRDIKPANLVVNVQGTLKILDMGLAQLKAIGGEDALELTQMGQAMGTIDYMAPEQAVDAHSVDHRADIYSLGCTMFYLLTARPISPEGSMVQKLLWHQTATRPSLRDLCADATERLDLIFQRMVAANPEERYSLMREVVEDLERVLPELRLGEGELPLIGDDLALYIGMEAVSPPTSAHLNAPVADAPLHATLPPQKAITPTPAPSAAPSAGPIEQQLAAAAIMIGKEVAAETADGRSIRGVVNRLSVECQGGAGVRAVRLHVGDADFALHEIREVFYGNSSQF
jgi:serine/threonine protein kinase